MPVAKLSPQQVSWVSNQVAAYIKRQRRLHRTQAAPLSSKQRGVMQSFFPASVLDSARLLTLRRKLGNPDFYPKLIAMGLDARLLPDFAEGMAAVTFQDVVVSHQKFSNRLLFHELVHAVQYQKLGVSEFAVRYVCGFLQGGGYDGIPLEINAYELEGRFAKNSDRVFSVESEVQSWIDDGRL
jgi:hypothetical protein